MICPNCGMETSPLDNGPCLLCKTTRSGLEKIEPLIPQHISYPYWSVAEENRAKLNEVIEKVNLIMAYLNQGVEK